jgi:hypothetical protein
MAGQRIRARHLLVNTWRDARTLLDKTIAGCLSDDVPEVVSLGHTLLSWLREIFAYHTTGASNGPTEGLMCVKKGEALRSRLPPSSVAGSECPGPGDSLELVNASV